MNQGLDQIRAELEALGETPLSEEEAGWLESEAAGDVGEDVVVVERLVELSSLGEGQEIGELSEFGARRGWSKISEAALPGQGEAASKTPQEQHDPSHGRGVGRAAWLGAAVALAAAVLLWFALGGNEGRKQRKAQRQNPIAVAPTAQEREVMGEQAHAGLMVLGGGPGTESTRAQAFADGYGSPASAGSEGGTPG